MKKFYTEDLDELIIFRSDEFVSERLPQFTETDIEIWNKYNEDIVILPHSKSYLFNKPIQEPHFSRAEGHPVDFRIVYTEIDIQGEPFVLMSRVPMIEDHDLYATMVTQYGLFLLLILLISLTLLQRIMSRKLWKPFYNTLDKMESFNLESGTIPEFEKTKTVEFSRLNDKITSLMTDNLSIYKRQKEFIENASHELQTPLAVFKSQLDMLLQQPDLTESNAEIIRSLYAVSARMTRMNKNLLLLARIDNDQFTKLESIDFVNVLYEQLLYLRELAVSEGLTVNVEVDNSLKVKANKLLLESLINNLVINAIRHNIENGTINIRVGERGFEISNTGFAQSLDKERIFRRFSRTSEEKKGNGLGLSIVQQICIIHACEIRYVYEKSYHKFIIKFKD